VHKNVVVDWDGTVTDGDTLVNVLLKFGDPEVLAELESRLGRDLTLHEVIAGEFETVRASLDEVVSWICASVRLRPGFVDFARCHAPIVVSSGFHEFIEPLLEREGLSLRVVANRLDAHRDRWRVLFGDTTTCTLCGEPCKRLAVECFGEFVYVGDGYSDRCVSKQASRVFARDELADYLSRSRVPFERFDDFCDVHEALTVGRSP
jgi:2-hydroxy-3-keto-5-methylthiopentenyl-1-phosphate phosphatase